MNKISVCMASCNGGKYIKEQIDSILVQLSEDDEVIISDDASIDNTVDIINRYDDSRIKLYENHFRNHILNFEFVLSRATGDYIFLSDQDDIWVYNKVAIILLYLQKYDLVCSDCIVIDSDCNTLYNSFYYTPPPHRQGFIKNLCHNNYLGCCMAFNSKVLKKSLPFPKKLITHDTWIGLVAEIVGNTIFIDDKLIYFRRHDNNTSNTLKGSTLTFEQKIKYRFIILKGLILNLILNKSNV